ncbi:MAG: methyltransferase domain-containing protein [Candidatus Thorarchaeota archaeon]
MTDTFGRILRDALEGKDSSYIIERDDGFIRHTSGVPLTLPYKEWHEAEKEAIVGREGPFLDIGCGVARVGDFVREQGMEYYGIDLSPLAVEMCHKRGHKNVFLMSADNITFDSPLFKTVVLYGNNFGLVGSPEGVVKMLKQLHTITTEDAVALAGSRDPEVTDNQMHLDYHAKNRAEGIAPCQVRLRNRYKDEVDDWWYLYFCGLDTMSEIAKEAGWYLDTAFGGPEYHVGILKKT